METKLTLDPAEQAPTLAERAQSHARRWVGDNRRLDPAHLDPEAALSSFGVDSITKVELVRSLERAFGVSVPEAAFHDAQSIHDLAVLISELARTSATGADRAGGADPAHRAVGPGVARADASPRAASPPASRLVLPTFNPLSWSERK